MRRFLGLFILLLAVGCGGGGGVPGGGPGPDPDPDPGSGDTVTQEILQDCLPELLTQATGLAALFDAVFQGTGSSQGVTLPPDGSGGFVVEGPPDTEFTVLQFEHDPGGGGALAGTGQLAFEDSGGEAAAIFTEMQVDTLRSGGIDAFGALMASIPDGTIVRAAYNGVGVETSILELSITVQGGQPTATTGTLEIQFAGCTARLTLDAVPFAGLVGNFPSGTFDILLGVDGDEVTGTLVTNGTATATASVQRNGGATSNWTFNLTTGIATPQ